MNLKDLAKASAIVQPNHSILIYGAPKTGKSYLAGTAARIKEINRIFYFDGENGVETLLNMGLTDEELEKVTVFKVRDTAAQPIFIETVLKSFTSKVPVDICDMHGRVNCAECKKASLPSTKFLMPSCTHNDLVILDSGSQLGDSAMASLCLGKDSMYKPGWDEYGIQGKWLGDILSVVQQATYTNFAFLTHEICIENDEKKDMFYPLMGTKAFSMKCAKYFGTVCYVHKKLNKHVAGSSSTYLGDRVTGSRVNAKIEKDGNADMRTILVEGGIIRPKSNGPADGASGGNVATNVVPITSTPSEEATTVTEKQTATATKPLTLKERLALRTTK